MIRGTARFSIKRNEATTVVLKRQAKCAHANFDRMKVCGVNQVSLTRDLIG